MPDANYMKSNGALINVADYYSPIPNGDESIVAAAAGVKTLTVPSNSVKAVITNPVACHVRFGAVPAVGTGTYYAAYQGIEIESVEELAQCQIYVTAATTLFIQYWR